MSQQMRHLVFLGRFRVLLIIGVIAHHCPLAWTLGEWWPVDNVPKTALLDGFLAVNYACGMAFFFLISGYLHPGIVDRDGAWRFLKKRCLKLGVPTVAYFVLVVPVIMYAYYLNFRDHGYLSFWTYYIRIYWGINTQMPPNWTGPAWSDQQLLQMWFSQHLLIFGLLYVVWRSCCRWLLHAEPGLRRPEAPLKSLNVHLSIVGYSFLLGLVYYLVRIRHPLYHWIGLFDAIQVEFARLPQRASLFVVGIIAYRRNWFTRLPREAGYVWTIIAAVLALLVYTRMTERFLPFTPGGTGAQALGYALLDAFLGSSICVGLLVLFRERYNTRMRRLGRTLARTVYCVYIIHLPIVVAIQYMLAHVPLPPVALATITGLLSIPLSFLMAHWMLRLPGVRTLL